MPEVVKTVPHVAFVVDDLNEALKGREILIAPTEPSVGVRVAFVLDDGAPVELLQFDTATAIGPKTRHAAEQREAGPVNRDVTAYGSNLCKAVEADDPRQDPRPM